ncbi:aldo/keto reductase family protein [Peribacillus deserti]|uniref:Aldo/keto reductase n=1 Tax=Peribacillus deserti TaxID=673318 RepID=A0A2N5M376_9BACI|nr:aldo/keto reductase family protein [Peribacillus deserti]PLT28775.1 aldo/keto reductase [Peribacillus deserti]
MRYRKLENSGLKVSEVSLGSYLTFGERLNEEESARVIHKAFHLGINVFDTANVYQSGRAEQIVASALKSFPRNEYIVATKAYWPVGNGANSRGLSRKHITSQVEASLVRMKLDYIDIFYCHSFDTETPVEETLRTIENLIMQGKILYAGVSNWNKEQLEEAVKIADAHLWRRIIVHQCEYSLIKRDIEPEIIPYSKNNGISQIVFSPLAQGILTGKYNKLIPKNSRATNSNTNKFFNRLFTKGNLEKAAQFESVARELGLTLSQLAISWVLANKNVSSALVGASSTQQIEENTSSILEEIPEDVMRKIEYIFNRKTHLQD